MDLGLLDKVAIVTGSSRGLGLASARALVEEGARVAICARGGEALRAAAASLEQAADRKDAVLAVEADVSTAAGAEAVVRSTLERFGRVDILINNVGKAGGGDIVSTSDADWQHALDQTLFPAIRMSRLVVPHHKRAAGGVVVIIATNWGPEKGGRMT
jgi:3-oxoacyl-[acyl-carrier protein] reductase